MEPLEIDIRQLIDDSDLLAWNAEWTKAFKAWSPVALAVSRNCLSQRYPQDIEDIAMMGMERLHRKLMEYRLRPAHDGEAKALLSTITRHMALDWLDHMNTLKKGGGKVDPFPIDWDPPDTNWGKFKSWVIDAKLIYELADGNLLTDNEKKVYEGRKKGLKDREIEAELGVPVKQVGIIWQRLIKKLQKKIKEWGNELSEKNL